MVEKLDFFIVDITNILTAERASLLLANKDERSRLSGRLARHGQRLN